MYIYIVAGSCLTFDAKVHMGPFDISRLIRLHVGDPMDARHLFCVLSGVVIGWYLRGLFPQKEEAICHCSCTCHHQIEQLPPVSAGWTPHSGVILCTLVVSAILLANLALVFKVSWSSKADEQELALVVSHQKGQGKARGVFNSPKRLQIKG